MARPSSGGASGLLPKHSGAFLPRLALALGPIFNVQSPKLTRIDLYQRGLHRALNAESPLPTTVVRRRTCSTRNLCIA